MTGHHKYSPSSATRWFACPGSVRKSEGLPEETSESSSEGTAAHEVRERCLRENLDPADLVGEKIEADGLFYEVTHEWADFLRPGIERIREAKGYVWEVEHHTRMDPWIPGGFGSLDTGGYSKNRIVIDDLKFGRWLTVPAERNKQLMIYALGFWKHYASKYTEATDFLLRIDQPRTPEKGDEWEVSLDELLVFGEEVKMAIELAEDPDAPLIPGIEQCMFCPAAKNLACEARDKFVLDLLGLKPDDLDADLEERLAMIETETLDPHRRSYVIKHAPMISAWVKALTASALRDAVDGGEVPGYKAVATQGDRTWANEEDAENFWRGKIPVREIFVQKLKSPAQLEKIAGTRNWNKAQELIHRAEGPPALVPETDKRPALIPMMELLDDLDAYEEESYEDLIQEATTETTDDCPLDDLI